MSSVAGSLVLGMTVLWLVLVVFGRWERRRRIVSAPDPHRRAAEPASSPSKNRLA